MTNFEKELLVLFEKYEVELSVDLDHGYDGSTVNTVDFDYKEDGKMKSLYVSGYTFQGDFDTKRLLKNIEHKGIRC